MVYGIGAILSGMIFSKTIKKYSPNKVLRFFFITLSISLGVLSVTWSVLITIVAQFFMGVSISSLRISRNVIMMRDIAKSSIGRVQGLLQSIMTMLTLFFTGIISWVIAYADPVYGYGLLFFLIVVSYLGVVYGLKGKK